MTAPYPGRRSKLCRGAPRISQGEAFLPVLHTGLRRIEQPFGYPAGITRQRYRGNSSEAGRAPRRSATQPTAKSGFLPPGASFPLLRSQPFGPSRPAPVGTFQPHLVRLPGQSEFERAGGSDGLGRPGLSRIKLLENQVNSFLAMRLARLQTSLATRLLLQRFPTLRTANHLGNRRKLGESSRD